MQPILTSRILTYFCIGLLSMAFQCEGPVSPSFPNNTFSEKLVLFPTQKQYKIGDTLWIQYANPTNSFFDTLTQQPITAAGLSFHFNASVTSLHKPPTELDRSFCDYLTAQGFNVDRTITNHGAICDFDVGCGTTGYDFTTAIILKQEGLFSLSLSDGYQYVWPCPTHTFPSASITFTFNVVDSNKDVYLLLPASKRDDHVTEQIDKKKAYIINVVK